ncbi:MAG TPA: aspartate/glutamate racemase family protein [Polyangia bacterium]|nr:aspartate/glutamate racemase family protein [Polyangia bacterium]
MKTIGLIGGTSWESTQDYYRYLNQEIRKRLGRNHSARIVLYSVDFQDVEDLVAAGRMEGVAALLEDAARRIEAAGADCLMIGANTMHMFAPAVSAAVGIPLVHMVEAAAGEVVKRGFGKVGLMGTRPTMEMGFYKDILARHGVDVLIPDEAGRGLIQDTIFRELFAGIISVDSRSAMIGIIDDLVRRGAEGVILGCTEIPLLVKQEHTGVPLLDTTFIHSCAAVDFALGDPS